MTASRIPEIGRFAVVGVINLSIDLAIFSVALYLLGAHLLVANTVAYSVATINSYLMNKYWTFAGKSAPEITTSEFTRFVLFNLAGLLLSNVAVFTFAKYVLPIIAKLGAVGVTFVWNYLTIRRYVFHKPTITKS
jgi:putative flippase GtrA